MMKFRLIQGSQNFQIKRKGKSAQINPNSYFEFDTAIIMIDLHTLIDKKGQKNYLAKILHREFVCDTADVQLSHRMRVVLKLVCRLFTSAPSGFKFYI